MDDIVLKALIPILTAIVTEAFQFLVKGTGPKGKRWSTVTLLVVIAATGFTLVIISNATKCAVPNLGWVPFRDPDPDLGSTITVTPILGSDCDFEVSFDLEEKGYVATYKKLDQKLLTWWIDGVKFSYSGTGEPNTMEFKLFGTAPSQDYRVILGHAADTEGKTVSVSIPYTSLTHPVTGKIFTRDGLVLDRLDFSFSNWPGDTPGTGNVIISDIRVIPSWRLWLIILSPVLLIGMIVAYSVWQNRPRG